MSKITIYVPTADHEAMVAHAHEYKASKTQVYQRAVALYLMTQTRVDRYGDFWPGDTGTEEGESDGVPV